MGPEKSAVRTNPLLVRNADDIKDNLVLGAELFALRVAETRRSDDEVSHQLVFLLVQDGLLHHSWLLADGEEEGSVEREESYLFPPEESRAKAADHHVLAGVNDLSEARLADAVVAGRQLPGEFEHGEGVHALAAFLLAHHEKFIYTHSFNFDGKQALIIGHAMLQPQEAPHFHFRGPTIPENTISGEFLE